MLAPETVLQGRYRIVRQLGQGGMGAVYEAVDLRLDATVALKETLFADEKLRKQFEREARLLARLHHPALPRVSDHFTERDGQFLVMQYIAGEDLAEMMAKRQHPFPPEEALRWADQLCDALDYLHTQDPQIIHRDIKPQNLKLSSRGQVVLLDFGLAKGSVGQMSVVTSSVSIFGYTPNYAPLEQVQGQGTDPRSDIYSLAATLYHLITGVKPPDALSRAGAIVNGQPDPLLPANAIVTEITPAIATALSRGMAQKRNDRYSSAATMRASLRAAVGSGAALREADTLLVRGVRSTATVAGGQETQLAGERETVIATEAQTLPGTEGGIRPAPTRPAPAAETETAVRPVPGQTRKFSAWQIAAGAIVMLFAGGGIFGAFYTYRARHRAGLENQPVVSGIASQPAAQTEDSNRQTAAQSPLAANRDTEAQAGATRDAKTEKQKPAAEPARERASARRSPEKTPQVSTRNEPEPPRPDLDRNRGRDRNPNVQPPPAGPFRNQQDFPGNAGRGRNLPGEGPRMRILPNGARVITRPDGTRIVTWPDGTTRVFAPGEKIRKRPN